MNSDKQSKQKHALQEKLIHLYNQLAYEKKTCNSNLLLYKCMRSLTDDCSIAIL